MRPPAVALALALVLFSAPLAVADVVVLDNGNRIEGRVTVDGDQVVVEMSGGRIVVERARVVRIIRSETPAERFENSLAGLDPTDAAATFQLSVWAREKGLQRESRRALERTIEIEPDHEQARAALGFHRHEGRWVTEDEYMTARGFVERDGRWISADEDRRRAIEEAVAAERARSRSERSRLEADFAARERLLLDRIGALEAEVDDLRDRLDRRPRIIKRFIHVPVPAPACGQPGHQCTPACHGEPEDGG